MKNNKFQQDFVALLTNQFPKKSELANFISETLNIEKDSAYRRLRGEVHFLLQEAGILAEKLSISLDEIIGATSQKKRSFLYRRVNYATPDRVDYEMADEFINFLKTKVITDPNAEINVMARMLPKVFSLSFENMRKFYLFKWLYQYQDGDKVVSFSDFQLTDRLIDIYDELLDGYSKINESHFILYKHGFLYLMEDIQYFVELGVISIDDLNMLKMELLQIIDQMESIAMLGRNKYGKKVHFYLSNINFDTHSFYIAAGNYKLSVIRAFTISDIYSLDPISFDDAKKYFQSMKRTSIQISESSEIVRKKFFNEQRAIVENM